MAKICIPRYGNGEFASLSVAYKYLIEHSSMCMDYTFMDMIQYNVYYRDYLRKYGLEALKESLFLEVPELKQDRTIFDRLEEVCRQGGFPGNYDVQCYNIHDSITIMGHTFKDLADVQRHCETSASPYLDSLSVNKREGVVPYDDIHIGEIYRNYPVFDSYDSCDDRTYQNYFFRDKAISGDDFEATYKLPTYDNFSMIGETIPEELLPLLYYSGEGNYMLLATVKP